MLPADPPERFDLGCVILRALTGDDWYVDYQLSRDPDAVRWTTIPAELSEEQARAGGARAVAARAEGRVARYVIVAGQTSVGTCGIGAGVGGGEAEVFYALLPAGRGRGTATAAARALAGWARDAGAASIGLMTHLDNAASQRVAANAGFERAGEVQRVVKDAEVTLAVWRFGAGRR